MAEKMTLEPCPFCGAPAAKNKNPGDRWVYYCPNGHTGYLRHKEWQARSKLAQPAQAVDVVAIKTLLELVEGDHGGGHTEADCRYCVAVNTITRAIGNAQAEGSNGTG